MLLTSTRREFDVLEHLVDNQGSPVTREELIRHAWDEMANPASNVLDVLIGQLRRKLGPPELIGTVRTVGYRIDPV